MALTIRAATSTQSISRPSRISLSFAGWSGDDIDQFTVVVGRKPGGAPVRYDALGPHYFWHLNDIDVYGFTQSGGIFNGTARLLLNSYPSVELSPWDHLWICVFLAEHAVPPVDAAAPLACLGPFIVGP